MRSVLPVGLLTSVLAVSLVAHSTDSHGQETALAAAETSQDVRSNSPIDLNGYFPFKVPTSAEAWQTRADFLRRRIRIATGLFPWPEKTPLNPVIHLSLIHI